MASLSQALRLGDLPPPHRTFQGHAPHIIEWSIMLRPNDSWSTCILQGIATFLHYASRRSAGLRYTTADPAMAFSEVCKGVEACYTGLYNAHTGSSNAQRSNRHATCHQ